mmetsp:Transcript_78829/g.231338  ORF Transcript_78829/g.231338 Transcript_78829/m.231338 type:complete len:82 (+) Transcript_78829:2753-2998(+)
MAMSSHALSNMSGKNASMSHIRISRSLAWRVLFQTNTQMQDSSSELVTLKLGSSAPLAGRFVVGWACMLLAIAIQMAKVGA